MTAALEKLLTARKIFDSFKNHVADSGIAATSVERKVGR